MQQRLVTAGAAALQRTPLSRSAGADIVRSTQSGTISICFVVAALDCLRAKRMDADALLARVGLSPNLLLVPQARVSVRHYGELWRLVALALDDEFFGQDSRRMKAGTFAMLCHSVVGCRTLAQALDRCLRFFNLVLDDITCSWQRSGGDVSVVLHERVPGGARRTFAHEVLLVLVYGVACWVVGRRIPMLRARFAYPEPLHSAEYRLMYCNTVSFGAANTGFDFAAGLLDLPVVQNETSIKDFLRTAPENILVKYKNRSSLSARIRRRLRQVPPSEVPDFDTLAGELNMAAATMRRRLHDEGASYQEIKDQLRRDLAISYLSHSDRSVLDIALELGFSERSAFHRAFRKWTGASPGEFRKRTETRGAALTGSGAQ